MKSSLLSNGRRMIALACMAAVLSVGLVFGPMSQSAAAVTCRERGVHASQTYFYLDGKWYQALEDDNSGYYAFTVPGSNISGCSYINIKNVTGGWSNDGGHTFRCWSFRVYIFDTNSWYPESGYCAGPNDVVGIAGPIANGITYSVYIIPNDNLHVTLRD